MAVSRKLYRQLLASEIGTALTNANLVQAVYGYRIGNFNGQSPVVIVTSAGSDRRQEITGSVDAEVELLFAVDVFVLYADKASSWTEANAEDAIDDIEQTVADWVLTNANGIARTEAGQTSWFDLTFNDRSATGSLLQSEKQGGQEYRRERMTITVHIRAGAS